MHCLVPKVPTHIYASSLAGENPSGQVKLGQKCINTGTNQSLTCHQHVHTCLTCLVWWRLGIL